MRIEQSIPCPVLFLTAEEGGVLEGGAFLHVTAHTQPLVGGRHFAECNLTS